MHPSWPSSATAAQLGPGGLATLLCAHLEEVFAGLLGPGRVVLGDGGIPQQAVAGGQPPQVVAVVIHIHQLRSVDVICVAVAVSYGLHKVHTPIMIIAKVCGHLLSYRARAQMRWKGLLVTWATNHGGECVPYLWWTE